MGPVKKKWTRPGLNRTPLASAMLSERDNQLHHVPLLIQMAKSGTHLQTVAERYLPATLCPTCHRNKYPRPV